MGPSDRDIRWNIRVSMYDDSMLREIMEVRATATREHVTQAGTLRRAVYELHQRECSVDDWGL